MVNSEKESMRYWNDPRIIQEFANIQAPDYWRDFFEGIGFPSKYMVLDLGCGGGRNTQMLASMGFQIQACDLHQGMVEYTRKRIGQFMGEKAAKQLVRQANMQKLPYDKDTFDIVLSNGIYHNTSSVEEFEKAIKETSRVLKDGGRLCLNVFTSEIIQDNLIKKDLPHLYLTPDNLDMILLTQENVVILLNKYNFMPEGDILRYPSKINNGVRSVMRGVFRKKVEFK